MIGVGKETTDLGIMFLELDSTTQKVVSKNTLITDEFKNKILLEGFEKQRQAIKQITTDIETNIKEVFDGRRTISS